VLKPRRDEGGLPGAVRKSAEEGGSRPIVQLDRDGTVRRLRNVWVVQSAEFAKCVPRDSHATQLTLQFLSIYLIVDGHRVVGAERIALKLRGAAAAIKRDPFPFKRAPHPDSFKRLLGGVIWRDEPR